MNPFTPFEVTEIQGPALSGCRNQWLYPTVVMNQSEGKRSVSACLPRTTAQRGYKWLDSFTANSRQGHRCHFTRRCLVHSATAPVSFFFADWLLDSGIVAK
jgi:hypothetical protein